MINERFAAIEARLAALERAAQKLNTAGGCAIREDALAGVQPADHAPPAVLSALERDHARENKSEGAASSNAPLGARAPAVTSCAGSDTPSDPPAKWTREQREAAYRIWCAGIDIRTPETGDSYCAEIAKVAHLFVPPAPRPSAAATSERVEAIAKELHIAYYAQDFWATTAYRDDWKRVAERAIALLSPPAAKGVGAEEFDALDLALRHLELKVSASWHDQTPGEQGCERCAMNGVIERAKKALAAFSAIGIEVKP